MEVIVKDEDRRQLLKAHNDLRSIIDNVHECHDIWMSDVGKLERLQHLLHHTLKFTAQVDDKGNKMWYRPYVYAEEVPSDE